ncbi:putative capsular associated protein [Phaeomoniella chlamydospora]|uniref:Putative capsular associated protein n=1 Tax=Phaeomoniella chlamydospora TaxID=158046 RepID=A0A0G2E6Z7_PHACM|nr:putative capsular associated protein [Phaeomoniella chlamydospora]
METDLLSASSHPIDKLIRAADKRYRTLAKSETHTLTEAARIYRARRGRHPPPGFDAWFKIAKENNGVLIESFFDQIYDDLEPFWGANPHDLREFAKQWPYVISIRHGKPILRIQTEQPNFGNYWLFIWRDMIQEMPPLPDVDLSMWIGDEPRVMLAFQHVTEYMTRAEQQRRKQISLPIHRLRNYFPSYEKLKGKIFATDPLENYTSIAPREYWDFVVDACKPDDPVHTESYRLLNSSIPPVFSDNYTTGSLQGYVSNFSLSKSVCHNPNLRSLHGHMIWPHLSSIYTDLKPIFGVAKLAGASNDILVPTPEHWQNHGLYAGLDTTIPWKNKKAAAVWRGSATGGQHNESNWWGFQRHRLISMMNSTAVTYVEHEMRNLSKLSYQQLQAAHPKTFDWGLNNIAYPSQLLFNITAQAYDKLGAWAGNIADGGFTHQYCNPWRLMAPANECAYTTPYYSIVPKLNMSEILHHKYLPDVDGQSSSGRFRGFLESLSAPIKATIFTEWHDARLVPWKHFIPMSNEFQEWWGLMEYFVGYKGNSTNETTVKGHDAVGEMIGRDGSEWTHRVERKEDMMLYFYRVILEYARICADRRVELGFSDDLSMS